MNELNITKGEWNIIDETSTYEKVSRFRVTSIGTTVSSLNCSSECIDEQQSNAQLIADAGTTANKCGLLPSELLAENEKLKIAVRQLGDLVKIMNKAFLHYQEIEKQRDALLEALRLADKLLKNSDFFVTPIEQQVIDKAIKSCEL